MKTSKRLLVAGLALALALGLALGAAASGKAGFKKFPSQVEAAFVKKVVDGKLKGVVVDARPARKKYNKGHIPGAISLPWSQFGKLSKRLPANKGALIVFYCGGLKCPLSHKSAFAAQKMGYRNLKVFAKGYPAWKQAYGPGPSGAYVEKPKFQMFPRIVKAALVKKVVDAKQVGLVIDARPKRKKYDKGHIPGAVSLPWSQFAKLKGLLPADKGALVVFYCGGLKCPLSHKSAFAARKLGYRNVAVFAQGYPGWKKAFGAGPAMAAAPKEAAKQAKPRFRTDGEGSIDHRDFKRLMSKSPGSVTIVDVRDPSEYAGGTLPGAVNLTSNQLEKRLASWKPQKPVIFICGTGARSGEAYYMVKDKRPDIKEVYYLDGELTIKKDGSFKLSPPK